MILEVRRTFHYLQVDTQPVWEPFPFELNVWQYDDIGGVATKFETVDPVGFTRGLLRCYQNGRQVTLSQFTELLHRYTTLTLKDVERMIDLAPDR